MVFLQKMTRATAIAGLLLIANIAHAEGGEEKFAEGVNYIPIKPPLVVNYGGSGKVKYIKAEISLRADNAEAAKEVTHHMPLIRDTLIMLISSVSDEQMSSGEGKEQMRVQALAKINEAIEAQVGAGKKEDEKKDAHAKDEKPKKDAHAKDDHAKSDKKDSHAKEEPKHNNPVSDLLFDNLVVQK